MRVRQAHGDGQGVCWLARFVVARTQLCAVVTGAATARLSTGEALQGPRRQTLHPPPSGCANPDEGGGGTTLYLLHLICWTPTSRTSPFPLSVPTLGYREFGVLLLRDVEFE